MVWWYFYHLSSTSHSWRKWLYFTLSLLNIIQSFYSLSDISSSNATFNLCLISFLLLVTKTKVHQKHISNSFSFSKKRFLLFSFNTKERETKQNDYITFITNGQWVIQAKETISSTFASLSFNRIRGLLKPQLFLSNYIGQ